MVAGLVMLAAPLTVAAQSIDYTSPSDFFLNTGGSVNVSVVTLDGGGIPAGGGTLTWTFDSVCDAANWGSPPSSADPSGTTSATLSATQPGFCEVRVHWDPDASGPQPQVSTPVGRFVIVEPIYTLQALSGPGSVVQLGTPASDIQFSVRAFADGQPEPSVYLQMIVNDPSGDTLVKSDCFAVTDANGDHTFSLADVEPPANTSEAGNWTATVELFTGGCRPNQRISTKGGFGPSPQVVFGFAIQPITLSVIDPPGNSQIPVGSPTTITVQVDAGGSPASGYVVDWSANDISGSIGAGSTSPTNGSGQATFQITPTAEGGVGITTSLAVDSTTVANHMLQAEKVYTFDVVDPASGVATVAPGAPVSFVLSVVDDANNPVNNHNINIGSDPPIAGLPSSVQTNGSGLATINFTAPAIPDNHSISLTHTGPFLPPRNAKVTGFTPLVELITLQVMNQLVANPDDFTSVEVDGPAGGNTATVYANDTYNGAAPIPAGNVTSTIVNDGGLTGVGINAAGELTVPAGSTGGTYTVTYEVCETASPSNCASSTAQVAVRGPVRTLIDVGTDVSPNYPSGTGTISVRALDDGAGASDTIVFTAVSGPVVLVQGGADVASPRSELTTVNGDARVDRRHTGTGLSTVTAHRLSDPTVSQTFQFETYQFLLTDPGTATTAVPGQTVALKALLRRQGASTTPVTGAAGTLTFTQTGGPTAPPPGGVIEFGGGNYDSMVTLTTPGVYSFQARFIDPAPPIGAAAQNSIITYTITVATASMSLAMNANPTSIGAPGPIDYTLTLTNTGAAALTSVNVNDTLPNGSPATLTGPSGDGGMTGVLDIGEVWTYTTQYTATQADIDAGAPLTNTATASAQSVNLPVNSNTATAVTTVTPPTTTRSLASVSGDGQQGLVDSTLPQPLVVIARNNGVPQAGVSITWTAGSGATLRTPGGATGATVSTITGADGTAQVSVTLGSTAGTYTITASRDDSPGTSVGFVATAVARPIIEALVKPTSGSGDGATGAPGTRLPLAALATRDGRPQAGVEVIWEVLDPNSSANPARSTTGTDGLATTEILLSSTGSGPITVRATRADGAGRPATYTLTISGALETLTAVSGDGQSGVPGSTLSDLVVRYTRDGTPVAGATVTWRVAAGDASLIGSTSTVTGSDGTARIGVRLGAASGLSTVIASTGNLSASFNLTSTTSRLLSLRVVSGDMQRGPSGSRADAPLVVKTFELVDGVEQAVTGQEIAWTVVSGPGSFDGGLTSTRTTTGGDGTTSLAFGYGSTAGTIRIQAQLLSTLQSVTFTATSFLPNLRIVSGNNQRADVGTALPLPLVVGIGDPGTAKNLAGVAINWRVVSGGGQLGSATSATGSDGTASNTLRLGPGAGDNVVEAALADGTNVRFTATGVVVTAGARFTIVSGDGQRLATNEVSAPLVVQLLDANNVAIRGARVVWTADNASVADTLTVTGVDGRTQTTAVLFDASGGSVTATLEGTSASLAFAINGGVVETSGLGGDQMRNAELVDALCPALSELQAQGVQLSAGQADLLARCLEIEDSAGPRPQEVQQALTELVTQIATLLSDTALDTLRTQLGNHVVRFDQLRALNRGGPGGGGGLAQSMGIGLMTPDGLVSLSLLPKSLSQAEGEGEGGGEVGTDFDRWGFFATGVIGRGESKPDSRTPDYDFDTSGITAGVDYRFNDRVVGGASLGFARHDTELAQDRGKLDTSGWTVSGYATWYNESFWFVDGVLSYGSNSYDLTRRIQYDITAVGGGRTFVDQVATADTDSTQLGGSISVGRDFQKGPWSLSTYLRGEYGRISFDGYTERAIAGDDGEGLVLTVDPRDLTSMSATLGGKATYVMSRDWGILMPHVQLELQQEFKDDPQRLATRFTFDPTQTTAIFEGRDVDSSLFNLGLGLSALFPGGRSAYVYYERLMGSSQIKQDTLSLGVRFEF